MAGIETPDARVELAGETPVAIIKRFDRTPGGRLMFVSAMTMLGIDDDDEHSYTEIADAIRMNAASPAADLEQLWRRLIFNVLVTNTDGHLKNHGFLHVESGQWRLSPAYDINPTPDKARELKTWISEEAGPEASVEGALAAASYFGNHSISRQGSGCTSRGGRFTMAGSRCRTREFRRSTSTILRPRSNMKSAPRQQHRLRTNRQVEA